MIRPKTLIASLAASTTLTASAATIVPTSYTYSVAPNHTSGYPDTSPTPTLLTDGGYGITYTDGSFVAWNTGGGGTASSITFVFDQAYNFTLLEIESFVGTSWAGFAQGVSISTSNDNITYTSPTALGNLDAQSDDLNITGQSGQYVTVAWTGSSTGSVWFSEFDFEGTPVPEPGSLALMAMGGMCLLRRRRS